MRLDFVYDAVGRRREKKRFGFDAGTQSWVLEQTTHFIWDGPPSRRVKKLIRGFR